MQRIKWKRTSISFLIVILTGLHIIWFQQMKENPPDHTKPPKYLTLSKPESFHYILLKVNHTPSFNRESINYTFHKTIWQNLTTPINNKVIYLYRAYYDDRPMHKGKTYLQILSVGAFTTQPVYAVVWTGHSIWSETITNCSKTKHGVGHSIKGLYYDQFFFSCEIKNMSATPSYVSLTYNKRLIQFNLLAIHIPEKKRKHKFSVCVETSYGHIDPFQLLEWVEANRLMGVTMFNVYPCNMSMINLKIFRQLESDGIMHVSMTPSPLPETTWANQMLSSPTSFNDCMMRQIYSAEYIIPLDFDEIISPRKNSMDYGSLLKEVDQVQGNKKPFPVYSFRMGLFFTTCGTNVSADLNIDRFIKRTNFYGNVKSIVNPRMCLSVFNHYCKVNFKSLKNPKRIEVKPEIAMVNHYRKSWSNRYCKWLEKDGIIDVIFRDKFSQSILKAYTASVERFRYLKLL